MQLDAFNQASLSDATEIVSVWARIPRWVQAVVADRPYASVHTLTARAEELAREWGEADLDMALAHHPRIGARVTATNAEGAASRSEQAAMSNADDATAIAMAAANAAYEETFGRVFLIRAAGRSASDMLSEAQRRLHNSDDAEVQEALEQLRQIALTRIATTFSDS